MKQYIVGQVVRHSGSFLRMMGNYTPPVNGLFLGVLGSNDGNPDWCLVQWSDGSLGGIEAKHLELDPSQPDPGYATCLRNEAIRIGLDLCAKQLAKYEGMSWERNIASCDRVNRWRKLERTLQNQEEGS